MKVTLIKVYTECDDHGEDIEMFRVYQDVDLLITPVKKQGIKTKYGSFSVNYIVQDLIKNKIFLYNYHYISHYDFWHDKERFKEKHLKPLLKKGWKLLSEA